MPSHKTHDLACYIATPIITIASLAYISPKESLLFGAGILVSNYLLSPDLDTNSIMNRRWSILHFIWHPYMRMFHHRSFFTHSGPISATIRLAYLCILLSPLLLVVPIRVPIPLFDLFICYMACCVSDSLHTLLDFISYATKVPFSFWKNTPRSHHYVK